MNKKIFFRSFYLSFVLAFCLIFGFLGIAKAYESIRTVAYGEYRKAIEIDRESIKIFDYEVKF